MFDNKERKKCKYWSFLDSIFKPRTMNIAVGTFLSNYLDFTFTDHSGENNTEKKKKDYNVIYANFRLKQKIFISSN